MFPVPEETARILNEVEVPGTPEAHNLHTTVVYLGKDVPIERIAELLPVLYHVTSRTLPFSLSTDLITTFPAGDDGVPVIAKVRSPELHAFHKSICESMEEASIDYSKKFPDYKPHVTVAYAENPDTEFELEIPEISWSAHELMLWGSDRGTSRLVVKFPLSFPKGRVASEHAYQRALVQLAMWGKQDRFV
jgi:2'-5' RNA ligase